MIREETMNFGVVVSVRGNVVDIQFHEYLPPIYSFLHAQAGENCHYGGVCDEHMLILDLKIVIVVFLIICAKESP